MKQEQTKDRVHCALCTIYSVCNVYSTLYILYKILFRAYSVHNLYIKDLKLNQFFFLKKKKKLSLRMNLTISGNTMNGKNAGRGKPGKNTESV